jgi:1-phosphofructokinase
MTRPTTIVTVAMNPAVDRVIEVPDFAIGEHQKGRFISRTPAGKGVNVARALASLGVSNIVTGFVGDDCFDAYETFLSGASVQAQLLRVAGRTRENITLIDPNRGVDTHIREAGFEVTPEDLVRLRNKLNLLAGDGALVIFSGSVPPGVSPQAFREIVATVLNTGAGVAVDTSGPALTAVADLPLWLVKPNVAELAELVDRPIIGDAAIVEAGRALSGTMQTVIVSCGAAGGYVFVGASALFGQVDLGARPVVNTVGCGDCLLAAFVAERSKGADVRDAYRQALAVATAAAVSLNPGEFDPAVVKELASRTAVEPVDDS